ncbi:MAG: hypothetical protein E7585_01195 [Ruminococcaceae bacterium]|nr:hypothetical protein [Oscillospiraceae bacterium]
MCKMCGFLYCLPTCPGYSGEWEGSGAVLAHCLLCEKAIHAGEIAFSKDDTVLCADCLEGMDLDQLLCVAEIANSEELLCEHLGWERRRL